MLAVRTYRRNNVGKSRKLGKPVSETISKTIGPQGMTIKVERGSHENHDYEGVIYEDPHIQSENPKLTYSPFAVALKGMKR